MPYVSLMVTAKQKPIPDTQKDRQESKDATTKKHQITKEESKKETKRLQDSQRTNKNGHSKSSTC